MNIAYLKRQLNFKFTRLAAAATAVVAALVTAVVATAAEEKNEDDDPAAVAAAVVTEKVTHLRCLLSFTLHTIANLEICYRKKKILKKEAVQIFLNCYIYIFNFVTH